MDMSLIGALRRLFIDEKLQLVMEISILHFNLER